MEQKTRITLKYAWVFGFILLGIILNYLNVGGSEFVGFTSVGSWLIYVGFMGVFIITLQTIFKKKRQTDERMEFIATKALKITFLFLIIGAFVLMIIDGIKTIIIPYHMFMSYMICVLLVIYFISYKFLIWRN
ncbi:MAG: hypothetical protein WCX73_03160 [Candidatus Pacearchaeota archaeon]|jgi:hypothetical protein